MHDEDRDRPDEERGQGQEPDIREVDDVRIHVSERAWIELSSDGGHGVLVRCQDPSMSVIPVVGNIVRLVPPE